MSEVRSSQADKCKLYRFQRVSLELPDLKKEKRRKWKYRA